MSDVFWGRKVDEGSFGVYFNKNYYIDKNKTTTNLSYEVALCS